MLQNITQDVRGRQPLSSESYVMAGCTNAVTGMLACILCDKKAILLVKTINENNRRNRNDVNARRGAMSLVGYVWQAAAGMQQISAQPKQAGECSKDLSADSSAVRHGVLSYNLCAEVMRCMMEVAWRGR